MGVYDTQDLKTAGLSTATGSMPGDGNLYNKGYLLEIEHVPTGYKVKFPAYLENFSDAYTQSWNAEDVYGRMDPIAVYQHTRRAVAMSWNIPANSIEQAKDNMDVINTLMTFMYPSYSTQGSAPKDGTVQGAVLNMSPLLRVKFLNLVHNAAQPDLGLMGYINGFTVDVRSDDGMFQQDTDLGPAVYPKTVALNFELNVLHEHAMGWAKGKEGDPVLRSAKKGFPYRTDVAVPSAQSASPPETTPPANQGSSAVNPGGGGAAVLAGTGNVMTPG